MHHKNILYRGKRLKEADKALILIHGRGGTAESMLPLSVQLNLEGFAILLPQAERNTWYPFSFLMPVEKNEPWLSSALSLIADIEHDVMQAGIPPEHLYIAGFSQGACLSLEFAARNAKKFGGVIAFTGGLIGDRIEESNYMGGFEQSPVFIGTSDPDPHVPVSRASESEKILKNMQAMTHLHVYRNMGHVISEEEIDTVNRLFFS